MLQGTKKFIVLGIAVLLLALPGSALAQSPTNDQYDDSSITVVGDHANPAGPGNNNSHSSLPFSGLDLGLFAVMGGGLLLLGFGMRRLTRRPDTA